MPNKVSNIEPETLQAIINRRPFVVGHEQLRVLLDVDSEATLKKNFLDKGLRWDARIGKKEYYLIENVWQWVTTNSDSHTSGKYLLKTLTSACDPRKVK